MPSFSPEHIDPSDTGLLGYAWLQAHVAIGDHIPLTEISVLAGTLGPTSRPEVLLRRWHKNYALPDDPWAHVVFALRYEPLRQDLLKAVFRVLGPEPWRRATLAHPKSRWAALAGFVYERLTGQTLDCSGSLAAPTEALDARTFFTASPVMNRRWHIADNLPGSPGFCPLVRRTPTLSRLAARLHTLLPSALAGAPEGLLERAGHYLAIKETRASFAIEHETPSPDRMRRFLQAVNHHGRGPLTPERLFAVQNVIVDNPILRSVPGIYRGETVYVGESRHGLHGLGWETIHFIAPSPDQVESLMADWFAALARPAENPLAFAASAAFGLVFLHPFPDGNGRVHRFVLQHLLAQGGLCPQGVALPLSAWFHKHPTGYDTALEAFSRPLMASLRYTMDAEGVVTLQNDLSDAYRYFDATPQAEIVGQAIEAVLAEDIPQEIQFLKTYDLACSRLKDAIDLPDKERDIAIHTILREGRLSKTKRDRFFPGYTDERIRDMERAVLSARQKTPAKPVAITPQGDGLE